MAPTGRRQFLGRAAATLGSATLAPFAVAGCSDDDGTAGTSGTSSSATTTWQPTDTVGTCPQRRRRRRRDPP
ncbi:MAG: hypothetical protein WKF45_08505 [Ilumatobacteraceae bacterium]